MIWEKFYADSSNRKGSWSPTNFGAIDLRKAGQLRVRPAHRGRGFRTTTQYTYFRPYLFTNDLDLNFQQHVKKSFNHSLHLHYKSAFSVFLFKISILHNIQKLQIPILFSFWKWRRNTNVTNLKTLTAPHFLIFERNKEPKTCL